MSALFNPGARSRRMNLFFAKWDEIGRMQGPLGYPTTDEAPLGDGVRFVTQFQHGSIIFSLQAGVVVIPGTLSESCLGPTLDDDVEATQSPA